MLFKDKKIVIIGGSSGIGFAVAKAAIKQGANQFVNKNQITEKI